MRRRTVQRRTHLFSLASCTPCRVVSTHGPFVSESRPSVCLPACIPPTVIRAALPTNIVLDPNFKIDIVNLMTRTVGLKVGDVVDVDTFKATFSPLPGQTEHDVLFSPNLWSTFMKVKLAGPAADYIQDLRIERRDLMSSTGRLPHALHAFVSICVTLDLCFNPPLTRDLLLCSVSCFVHGTVDRWRTPVSRAPRQLDRPGRVQRPAHAPSGHPRVPGGVAPESPGTCSYCASPAIR